MVYGVGVSVCGCAQFVTKYKLATELVNDEREQETWPRKR